VIGPTINGEDCLEDVVHRDPEKDEADAGGFGEVHQAKDDPIGQPLLIVVGTGAFDCLNREISGKSPADEVGNGRGETEHVEEDQDDEREDEGEDTVGLGNTSTSFEVTKDREFVELGVSTAFLMYPLTSASREFTWPETNLLAC
jgi:hypothetical protein